MPFVTATTFGCPRLGNTEFSTGFDAVQQVRHWRVQNGWDPITRSPFHGPKPVDFRHTGLHVWLRHGYDSFPPLQSTARETTTHSPSTTFSVQAPKRESLERILGVFAKVPELSELSKLKPLAKVVPSPKEVRVMVAHRGCGGVSEGAPPLGGMSGRAPLAIVSEALKGSHGLGHHQMGGARGYLASLEQAIWSDELACTDTHLDRTLFEKESAAEHPSSASLPRLANSLQR
jgi:hypothetical protein